MESSPAIAQWQVRCQCGWRVYGTKAEVVAAFQEHGREVHSLELSEEQVMAQALSELPWSADFVMQAIEILVVSRRNGELLCLRPDCAESFVVGWPAGARPEEAASKALAGLGLAPLVLHSTSWCHSGEEVVLTYLAVVSPDALLPLSWEVAPVAHAELARGGATTPPPMIGVEQVLEHALRHLSWLLREDEVVIASLPGWRKTLLGYSPEPFRALGGPPQ